MFGKYLYLLISTLSLLSSLAESVDVVDICKLQIKQEKNIDSSGEINNCFMNNCQICCKNGVSSRLEQDLNMLNDKACTEWEVAVSNYTFENGSLDNGFFGYKNVTSLKLLSSNISFFAAVNNLNDLIVLELENLHITELHSNMLNGMSKLKVLSIIQQNTPINNISKEFMWPVFSTLNTLNLQIGSLVIPKITDSYYPITEAEYINFSYNNFSNIRWPAFSQLEKIKVMNLSYSQINFLPSSIFKPFSKTIEILDLSHNNLKTISFNIFRENPQKLSVVVLQFNNWHCDCKLKQTLTNFNISTIKLNCSSPIDRIGTDIFDNNFCEGGGNSNVNESSTYKSLPNILPYTERITTQRNSQDNMVKLTCKNQMKDSTKNIFLQHSPFKIQKKNNLGISIEVNDENTQSDFSLIWFTNRTKDFNKMSINYNQYGLGCNGSFSRTTELNRLQIESTYTFCLKLSDAFMTSPLNCKSFFYRKNLTGLVPKPSWTMSEHYNISVISIIIGSLISVVSGAFIVYCVIKNKPSLLRGRSKRVISPKKSSSNIIILPKGQQSIFAFKEETCSISSSTMNIRNSMKKPNLCFGGLDIYDANLYEKIEKIGAIKDNKRNSNDPLPAIPTEEKENDIYSTIIKNNCYLIK